MRGISEELLRTMHADIKESLNINSAISDYHYGKLSALSDAIGGCHELQEPWIPIDEFLRSEFIGACWVYTDTEFVYTAYYAKDGQFYESDLTECRLDRNTIIRVMPLHKPDPLKL